MSHCTARAIDFADVNSVVCHHKQTQGSVISKYIR